MLPPSAPVLLNLLVINATLETLTSVYQTCLADRYYGTYDDQSIFKIDPTFFYDPSELKLHWQASSILVQPHHELLFLKKMEIESVISDSHTLLDGLEHLAAHIADDTPIVPDVQLSFTKNAPVYSIPWHTDYSALLSISPHLLPHIDKALPPSYKAYALPKIPLPFRRVSDAAKRRIRRWTRSVKYDDEISLVVEGLSISQLRKDVRYLTGEDPDSPILSRSSFSEGGRLAAEWILEQIEETGAECELRRFLPGFSPNGDQSILSQYESLENTTSVIILSSHYDSRGSFGNSRSPGGNDDGSGTAAILSIAREIAKNDIFFDLNVQLVAFAGEEQGLWGSRNYARHLRNQGADVTLMVHSDMLAYHVPGEHPQLAFPKVGTQEVNDLIHKVASIYSPELAVGSTPACCSDHQSFHEQGFPATQIFERAGKIADPMYHNSGDLSDREGYDFKQLRSITKVLMATLLHTAGYELDE